MDCYRSENRWDDVKYLWAELADVSPDAATVAEGKIVYANSYADQGNYPKAINILEKGGEHPSDLKNIIYAKHTLSQTSTTELVCQLKHA